MCFRKVSGELALFSSVNNYSDEGISVKTIKTICQSLAGLAASAMLALGVAESALAFKLITDPSNDFLVTGIEGLDIDGTKYDVSFIRDSFNNVYGNDLENNVVFTEENTPLFWGDSDGAKLATTAIIEALDDTYYVTYGYQDRPVDRFYVPYYWENGSVDLWEDYWNILNVDLVSAAGFGVDLDFSDGEEDYVWTKFVEIHQSVPEPASTIAILAVAGTGLLATRKRKK
ncbi:MAG: PEP-CTERM sorting domain-containing protein [Cyanobacteria bacterium SBLK]|nr:PEP-CTERM sorting domain-containing protein [Cyanobacteria bacterium SBLK]